MGEEPAFVHFYIPDWPAKYTALGSDRFAAKPTPIKQSTET